MKIIVFGKNKIDKRIEAIIKEIAMALADLWPYEKTYREWMADLEHRKN